MRTWTKLVPAVLLAMSSALAPVCADTPNNDKSNAEKIAELQKEVNDLKREVKNLKEGTAQDIREIKDLLKQMAQQGPVVSRSGFTPGAGGSGNDGPSAPGTATVYLRNQYGTNATFRINSQSFLVEPNRTMTVKNVPVGTIAWEVSVDGYGQVVASTSVSLTSSGRTFTVFPVQP
jgi:septal ring factor EnvC (AmiA/AmiB activator)